MFESFKNFISEFVNGEKHPSQFADDDYRLAAAALSGACRRDRRRDVGRASATSSAT